MIRFDTLLHSLQHGAAVLEDSDDPVARRSAQDIHNVISVLRDVTDLSNTMMAVTQDADMEDDEECPYCIDIPSEMCTAMDTRGYGCTRTKGHEGEHITCSVGRHQIADWPNKKGA